MMEDENMPLAYHHHMGTVIETEEDTYRLIENTKDSVKLLIDTGHMLFAGGDYNKITKDLYSRIILWCWHGLTRSCGYPFMPVGAAAVGAALAHRSAQAHISTSTRPIFITCSSLTYSTDTR